MFNQRLCVSQLPTDVSYLASDYPKHRRCSAMTSHQFSDPHILLEAYRQRARRFKKMLSQYLQTLLYIHCIYIHPQGKTLAYCIRLFISLNDFFLTVLG